MKSEKFGSLFRILKKSLWRPVAYKSSLKVQNSNLKLYQVMSFFSLYLSRFIRVLS